MQILKLLLILILSGILFSWACTPETNTGLSPLEISDDEIRGADGTLLLRLDVLPANIRVDDQIQFGATNRFLEAALSPDQNNLVVVTGGTSHSAGWLISLESKVPLPAAFQYGGGLSAGPWSEDCRWAVFIHEGPAGDRTLSVSDRERSGETVQHRTVAVQTPDHYERPPEERNYENEEWQNSRLHFHLDGESWAFNPDTGMTEQLD